jgi:hypothetical protein
MDIAYFFDYSVFTSKTNPEEGKAVSISQYSLISLIFVELKSTNSLLNKKMVTLNIHLNSEVYIIVSTKISQS